MRLAIIGASGVIGQSFLQLLETQTNIQAQQLRLVTSSQSAGKNILFRQHPVVYENLSTFDFSQIEVCFFATDAAISKAYLPLAQKNCRLVIDNSSAYRQDPNVPLIIPEINFSDINHYPGSNTIANPNCTTIGMLLVMAPIHRAIGIQRLDVATYQSITGAGQQALKQFIDNLSPATAQKKPEALNVVPKIDTMECNGYSREELKMHRESQKILRSPQLVVSATCVRVPVIRGHAASVSCLLDKPVSVEKIQTLLENAPSVMVHTSPEITPVSHGCQQTNVHVSRLRADLDCSKRFHCWIVSDNLLRGGSYNAFSIFRSWLEQQHSKQKHSTIEPNGQILV